jgi:hypothetical protein
MPTPQAPMTTSAHPIRPEPLARAFARVALASCALLLVPAVAMQFTDEVNWGPGDFAAATALLFAAGAGCVIVARLPRPRAQRIAIGLAIVAGAALVWAELAVGLLH